ncbi:hypothetical protein [Hydrogenophaga sp.]|uniref:hypothetical protein n=1 Tax=Hydrogenophaga sp. TaxID=1904254 RepID=UPI0027194DA3|nr:hypothetical protein [Hydrogenophaga sp.]MDO9435070.1 hypothetical protein [Hydrogenophaga sp.]
MTRYLRKLRPLMAVGLLCVFLLGGCGGGSSPTPLSLGLVGAGSPAAPGGPVVPGDTPDIEIATRYIKASNTGSQDYFGFSTALSADGNTLAVGAHGEASNARGINQPQHDESAANAGAVYVFVRSGNTWIQQAYIKASNADRGDAFGYRLALSNDGNTLAVGAIGEDSDHINDPGSASAGFAGAVYVFARTDHRDWHEQAYLKASDIGTDDMFGSSLAISGNGNTLVVGATGEDVDGAPGMKGMSDAGGVYVFGRTDTTWAEQAHLKPGIRGRDAVFGHSVALSEDGTTLAVGAIGETNRAGVAYIFRNSGAGWNEQAILTASNSQDDDRFGYSVALSADGQTVSVGATGESSADPANQHNEDLNFAGAVYVFAHSAGSWSQQAYVKASNPGNNDEFGGSVAISADGRTMVVGARHEASNATGINGTQNNDELPYAGAVYAFTRNADGSWTQRAYVKASNPGENDEFGTSVSLALSAKGITLVVGAAGESSNATGIDGNQDNDSFVGAGAVYVGSITLN